MVVVVIVIVVQVDADAEEEGGDEAAVETLAVSAEESWVRDAPEVVLGGGRAADQGGGVGAPEDLQQEVRRQEGSPAGTCPDDP